MRLYKKKTTSNNRNPLLHPVRYISYAEFCYNIAPGFPCRKVAGSQSPDSKT